MASPVMVLTTMAPISLSSMPAARTAQSATSSSRVESVVHEHFGPLLPAMFPLVPLGGLAHVARLDPGVAEETFVVGEAGEQSLWRAVPRPLAKACAPAPRWQCPQSRHRSPP